MAEQLKINEAKAPAILEKAPLKGKVDTYNGIIVNTNSLPEDDGEFRSHMKESLSIWREAKIRGVWLKIPIEKSHLIHIAFGFIFHHAESTFLMLTQWLPKDSPSSLPRYATHVAGVGGFVYNEEKNEVLVVMEKNGPVTSIWKMPGGMIDPGEEIFEAAIREVREETGIETEFTSLVCFRQAQNYNFGITDLYFVCKLKPKTFDIKLDPKEIKACKWMKADEFFNLPYYQGLYKRLMEVVQESAEGKYEGLKAQSLPIVFRPGNNVIYHGSRL